MIVISPVPLLCSKAFITSPDLHLCAVSRAGTRIKAIVRSGKMNHPTSTDDGPHLRLAPVAIIYLHRGPICKNASLHIKTFIWVAIGVDEVGSRLVVGYFACWAEGYSETTGRVRAAIQGWLWCNGAGVREACRRRRVCVRTVIIGTVSVDTKAHARRSVDGFDIYIDVDPVGISDDVIIVRRTIKPSTGRARSRRISSVEVRIDKATPIVRKVPRCPSAERQELALGLAVDVDRSSEGAVIDDLEMMGSLYGTQEAEK